MSTTLDSQALKPRNKLRKLHRFRPGSLISNISPRCSSESTRSDSSEKIGRQTARSPREPITTCAPDLSSPKWQEYVRKSGSPLPMERSPARNNTRKASAPARLVPELAHLVAASTSKKTPCSHISNPLPLRTSSPRSPASKPHTTSTSRRYAKTPVLHIGQLESSKNAPLPPLPPWGSDAEVMAAQYRALLGTRSDLRLDAVGAQEDHQVSSEDEEWFDAVDRRQQSLGAIRTATSRRKSPPAPLLPPPRLRAQPPTPPGDDELWEDEDEDDVVGMYGTQEDDVEGSPTSDGTLVAFEEDAIYFKPSFSPLALSPILEDGGGTPVSLRSPSSSASPSPAPSPAPTAGQPKPDTLGLQICMDLLTRELASSLRRTSPRRTADSSEVPSLQVWLMIEAYEKLRDQVLDMRLGREQEHALDDMLGMWLGALYKVHDDLLDAGRGSWSPSEDEVEALPRLDLD